MATSQKAVNKYLKNNWSSWSVRFKNDEFEKIEEIREQEGLSRAEFLKMLINEKYNKNL